MGNAEAQAFAERATAFTDTYITKPEQVERVRSLYRYGQYYTAEFLPVESSRYGKIGIIDCLDGSKVLKKTLEYNDLNAFLQDYYCTTRWLEYQFPGFLTLYDIDVIPLNSDSTKNAISFYFEYPTFVLDDDLLIRKRENRIMKADELLKMIGEMADALISLHQQNLHYGDLRPGNICLVVNQKTKKQTYKLLPLLPKHIPNHYGILFQPNLNYARDFNPDFFYTSPAVFKALCCKALESSEKPIKSDVFSLAVVILELGTLFDVSKIYDKNSGSIIEKNLSDCILIFDSLHQNYRGISDILSRLTPTDETLRADPFTVKTISGNPVAASNGGVGTRIFTQMMPDNYENASLILGMPQRIPELDVVKKSIGINEKLQGESNQIFTDDFGSKGQLPNFIDVTMQEAKLRGFINHAPSQLTVPRDDIQELSNLNNQLTQILLNNQPQAEANLIKLLGVNQVLVNRVLLKLSKTEVSDCPQTYSNRPQISNWNVPNSLIDQLRSPDVLQDYSRIDHGQPPLNTMRIGRHSEMRNDFHDGSFQVHRGPYQQLDSNQHRNLDSDVHRLR